MMSFGIFIITGAVGAYFLKTGENTVGDLGRAGTLTLTGYFGIIDRVQSGTASGAGGIPGYTE